MRFSSPISLALSVAIAGCAPSSDPGVTVEAYLKAIQEGRQEDARAMLCFPGEKVEPPLLDSYEVSLNAVASNDRGFEFEEARASLDYAGRVEEWGFFIWDSDDFFSDAVQWRKAANDRRRKINLERAQFADERGDAVDDEPRSEYLEVPERADINQGDRCIEVDWNSKPL